MMAPIWMNAVIGDFGRAAGLGSLALNDRGAAVLKFENGASLRLEYTGAELVMAITIQARDVKRLLSLSHPKARFGLRVRTGIMQKTREAVMAVRLAERDGTLAHVNAAFDLLWRLSGEIGGAAWA